MENILSKNYKIATYYNGEFVKYGYPHRYLNAEIDGLDNGIDFYLVKDVQPEPYNVDQYEIKPLSLELTTEASEFDGVLIAYQKYKLIEYNEDTVIEKITSSCESHINNTLPAHEQIDNISRFIYLQIMQGLEGVTQERADEMAYLNELDTWVRKCRELKQDKIDNYKKGDFPDLTNWPTMPINI